MIRSMTAYGRGTSSCGGKEYLAELKSVNNRFLDINVKMPRAYSFLEENIKTYIQQQGIVRGKVDVYIGVDIIEDADTVVALDSAYAESYINALYELRDKFGLTDDISVMRVAQNRDVFTERKPDEDIEKYWEEIKPALDGAIKAFTDARLAEGENLRKDLLQKKANIEKIVEKIKELSEQETVSYLERLKTRLKNVLGELDIELDSARILTECAVFADKTAVDEEIVRLGSHFIAFETALSSDEPAGRRMDFLLQEMNREVNTIGSKCNSKDIAPLVVDAKCELEKIREQIQNIE